MAIRSTHHIRQTQRIALLAALGLAIIAGIFLTFGARMAKADGYLPNQPGYDSTKDEATIYQHQPTTHIKRARYDREDSLRRYVSKQELRELERIKRRAEQRRLAAERRRYADAPARRRPVAAYVEEEPRRERYAQARVSRYDDEDERPVRRCEGSVKAAGHERLGESRARTSAENAWRTAVSAELGYRFSDLKNARGTKLSCNNIRGRTFGVFVCVVSARPCREL